MKNKEKYAKEIVEIACSGDALAVSKVTGKPISCTKSSCEHCNCYNDFLCEENRLREWAESEYIKNPAISKRDRAFLEYIDKKFDYIARTCYGDLRLFVVEPRKGQMIWTSGYLTAILDSLNIDFPMVKWENDKPWLIEDLKKLEVVEEYEKH